MNVANDLLDLALRLSPQERASLARKLLLSLEPETSEGDDETEWNEELESRLKRVEQGEYTATEWRDAISSIRQSLAQRSSA